MTKPDAELEVTPGEDATPPHADPEAEATALRHRVAALETELAAVYASRTWKTGRAIATTTRSAQHLVNWTAIANRVARARWAVAARRSNEPPPLRRYHELRNVSDDAWLSAILASLHGKYPLGPLPAFPDPEYQAGFVGGSGEHTMREAFSFYLFTREQCRRFGVGLGADARLLDFGVGWGRFARLFLRDLPSSGMTLADPWEWALRICEETGVPGERVLLDQMPPAELPSSTYDLAFAYSVFSHLSPKAHEAWKEEFARVVRPGGLAVITTQGKWFLDQCENFRLSPVLRKTPWHDMLAQSFGDLEQSRAAYDRGEMLYEPNGGGPSLPGEFYGDAIVPRAHFEQHWAPDFEVVDWVADPTRFEQAAVVLRRR